jgi:hypothetical protein
VPPQGRKRRLRLPGFHPVNIYRHRFKTNRHRFKFNRHRADTPQHCANPARHRANSLRHRASPARHRANSLRHRANPTRHRASPARHRASPARHRANSARHRMESPRRRGEAAAPLNGSQTAARFENGVLLRKTPAYIHADIHSIIPSPEGGCRRLFTVRRPQVPPRQVVSNRYAV